MSSPSDMCPFRRARPPRRAPLTFPVPHALMVSCEKSHLTCWSRQNFSAPFFERDPFLSASGASPTLCEFFHCCLSAFSTGSALIVLCRRREVGRAFCLAHVLRFWDTPEGVFDTHQRISGEPRANARFSKKTSRHVRQLAASA